MTTLKAPLGLLSDLGNVHSGSMGAESAGQVEVYRLSDPGAMRSWRRLQRATDGKNSTRLISQESLSTVMDRLVGLFSGQDNLMKPDRLPFCGNRRRIALSASLFVEKHFCESIRMEDLCKCTGASVRTVQRSFLGEFGCTPNTYIRLHRLHEARRWLANSDASDTSVTEVAHQSGCNHLGHFSQDYKRLFGESPSATLSRRSISAGAVYKRPAYEQAA